MSQPGKADEVAREAVNKIGFRLRNNCFRSTSCRLIPTGLTRGLVLLAGECGATFSSDSISSGWFGRMGDVVDGLNAVATFCDPARSSTDNFRREGNHKKAIWQ